MRAGGGPDRSAARAGRLAAGLLLVALAASGARAQSAADLEALEAAIQQSRERVAAFEREERGLLEAVDAIERSAELLQSEAERAGRAAVEAREALAGAAAIAAEAEARLAELETAMARRAVALYRAGELGAVRLLFSSGGLRDFFQRVQTLRLLLTHDTRLLSLHREQTRAFEIARTRAAEATATAQQAEGTLAQRTRELAVERARKRDLARRLGRNRALERGALAELEVAARALEETVAAWREAPTQPGVGEAPEGPAFAALRGRLPHPVSGRLRGRFGKLVDRDTRTATFRKGVAWEAPLGTPVQAVAGGRVRFAGRFRGYGNVVILDHGDDYFTVSAHLDRIAVSLGEPVVVGARIGEVGETGTLEGSRLYFEIRRGGKALDPARWLDARGAARAR